MSDRDVEKEVTRSYFAETLRRIADAVEKGESFRIQVAGKRLTVPADAALGIAHESEDGDEELELEFTWNTGDAESKDEDKDDDEDGDDD